MLCFVRSLARPGRLSAPASRSGRDMGTKDEGEIKLRAPTQNGAKSEIETNRSFVARRRRFIVFKLVRSRPQRLIYYVGAADYFLTEIQLGGRKSGDEELKEGTKGASIYDVRKNFGIFDPLPPLSAFGTDLQY